MRHNYNRNAATIMKAPIKDLDQLVALVKAVSSEARAAADKMNATYSRILDLRGEAYQMIDNLDAAGLSQADSDILQNQFWEVFNLANQVKKSTDFRTMTNLAGKFYDLEEKIQRTKYLVERK